MATRATPKTPRLGFNFLIEVNGVNAALVEKVGGLKQTIEEVQTSPGGVPFKYTFAAGVSYDDITLEKIMPADEEDNWAYDWMKKAVDPVAGKLGLAADYKKEIAIHHLDLNGNVLQTWRFAGAWIKEVSVSNADAMNKADKVMQTVVIKVDYRM